MNNRIGQVRKLSGYNQTEFAKKLSLTKNYISLIENGNRIPSDRTIKDICREFRVNETWLRTGDGEMLQPVDQDAEILGNYIGDIKNLITALSHLSKLSSSDWERLEQLTASLSENYTYSLKAR